MAITDWPADERPREKLLAKGAEFLSDAELLAIFLRVGVTGKSAVDLARDLLTEFGSLNGIFSASREGLTAVHGMGNSKYVQLQAIFEMSRRALHEEMQQRDALSSPQAVRDYLCLKLGRLSREVFVVLFLVKRVLHHNAAAVIFAHNHPSGVAEPSRADESLTSALKQALGLVDVRVLDHFVIAGNGAVSFAERGLL
jgi:DNA repair protein RadC